MNTKFLNLLRSFTLLSLLTMMLGVSPLVRSTATLAAPVSDIHIVDDFEAGVPSTWFQYGDYGAGTSIATTTPTTDTVPGLTTNHVLSIAYNSAGWGAGTGNNLAPEDWSAYDGMSFWFKGLGSDATFRIVLSDNKSDPNLDTAERFAYEFVDTSAGWQHISIPWGAFFRDAWQPGGEPNDGLTLTEVWAYALVLPIGTSGTVYMDQVAVFGGLEEIPQPVVDFAQPTHTVSEDVGEAVITVALTPAATDPVTVTYASLDLEGTATAGADYTAVSGDLVFAPGQTEITFTVPITDDAMYEMPETVWLALSDPASGGTITILLGGENNPAMLTIMDNDPPPDTQLIDDFESSLPYERNAFNTEIGFVSWGSNSADMPVLATTTIITPIPGSTTTNTVLSADYNIGAWGGFNHSFSENGEWVSQDWSAYDGLRFWLYGNNTGGTIQVEIFDNQALGSMSDSAERYYARITDDYTGWKQFHLPFSIFQRRTDWQPSGAPNDGLNLTEVSAYSFGLPAGTGPQTLYLDQVEIYGEREPDDMPVRVQFSTYAYAAAEDSTANVRVVLNRVATETVTVDYTLAEDTAKLGHDYSGPVSGTLTFAPGEMIQSIFIGILKDRKIEGNEQFDITLSNPAGADLGWKHIAPFVVRDVPEPGMIDDFEQGVPDELMPTGGVTVTTVEIPAASPLAIPGQDPINTALSVTYQLPAQAVQAIQQSGGGFIRDFGTSKDWTTYDAFDFWFYGMNTGTTMTVQILDNKAPDPGPEGWVLTWNDEFDGAAGAEPDQTKWGYDIGGSGWGNAEWEYYTAERENSAQNGDGQLVITATESTDEALQCTYTPAGEPGTCAYTSARLLTNGKFDFVYGRAEARLKLPYGQGIWPAFWSLGNNFGDVGWPAAGEIDIMENIGVEPDIVHGTVHGPGYSGANGIGGGYTYTEALSNDYHVYAIEWEPDEIRWYFDDTQFFTLTHDLLPVDAPWVFDHPFFLIMNVAVGGYWPGYPDETTEFPQTMNVDYVRVYQAPTEPERFETAFIDNFTGWQKMTLPFTDFVRSAEQPVGAPDDGLTLSEMWGYGFWMPAGSEGAFYLDDIRLVDTADLAITKTRSGTGVIIPGDTITFNLSVANLGPTDPVVAKVIDTWSPAEAVVAVNAPDFCDVDLETATIECTLTDLGTLVALPFPVGFTTAADFVGVLTNQATVSVEGDIVDPYTDNNTAIATATLTAAADLSVTLTDTPDPVAVDEALTYTIIVTNDGPISATQVMVTDTLPITVSFSSATASQGTCEAPAGQNVVCNLGSMDKGDIITITLLVTPTAAGTLTNVVNVAAQEYDPDPTNNTANITTTAEISRYTIFLPLVKRND
ncbi:MAG: CIA30 family protein [Anaerolineae bacterium]|nr:CIA30 family protein [Anaerolineae bacterium]